MYLGKNDSDVTLAGPYNHLLELIYLPIYVQVFLFMRALNHVKVLS
jgi:hypothetical protein